ncbi:MAG: hypothetical protein J5449_04315 [Oscillospiraceae bacterium]|nr:hypothetical protein [Oscillospiraceae bacterium]
MTEQRLRQIFDYQRFERNARLQTVIDAAHDYAASRELDDDELGLVSAAGVTEPEAPDNGEPRK